MGLLAATLYMRGMIRGAVDGWDPNRTRVKEGIPDSLAASAIIRACEGRPRRLLWRIARAICAEVLTDAEGRRARPKHQAVNDDSVAECNVMATTGQLLWTPTETFKSRELPLTNSG